MNNPTKMKHILALLISAVPALCFAQSLSVNGSSKTVVTVTPEQSTGLSEVYVVDNLAGCTISYTASAGNIHWQQYSNLGGGYAEDVKGIVRNGNVYTITPDGRDMGYIIDDGNRRHCFWVVNYANHRLDLQGVTVSIEDSDCDRTVLMPAGKGDAITYFSVNGRAIELSRDIEIAYRTLTWNGDALSWQQTTATTSVPSLHERQSVDAPLCDTEFTLTGDRFLKAWGEEQSVTSATFSTTSVRAEVTATQTEHEGADNETKPETSGLGGSAPCEITFTAYPTDAAVFKEWQFSATEDFDDISDRYAQEEFTHTFNDEGTVYVRFQAADASGVCTYDSQVFTVSIGASKLDIPNAFSPANQDGVNDLWKVSYTSITSFECNIFNRWGTKLATLRHPSEGWDGRYNGKFVPAGVYFYVIKAVGADGKKYNKSGDINIINSRRDTQNATGGGETTE